MRKLFYLLIPVFALFIACEADEIFDINQEIKALDAKVEEQGDELRAADAANFAALQQIIDNVVAEQARVNEALQAAIDEEAAAREAGDEAVAAEAREERNKLAVELTEKISDLAETTAANDAKLLDLINAEAEARANGDLKLAEEIADQVKILKTKDQILQDQILSNARFMSGVASDLANEVAERKVVTDSLQTQITSNTLAIADNAELIDGNKNAINDINDEIDSALDSHESLTSTSTLSDLVDILTELENDVELAEEQLSDYIVFDENIVSKTDGYTYNFFLSETATATIQLWDPNSSNDFSSDFSNSTLKLMNELDMYGTVAKVYNNGNNFELKFNELDDEDNGKDLIVLTTNIENLEDSIEKLDNDLQVQIDNLSLELQALTLTVSGVLADYVTGEDLNNAISDFVTLSELDSRLAADLAEVLEDAKEYADNNDSVLSDEYVQNLIDLAIDAMEDADLDAINDAIDQIKTDLYPDMTLIINFDGEEIAKIEAQATPGETFYIEENLSLEDILPGYEFTAVEGTDDSGDFQWGFLDADLINADFYIEVTKELGVNEDFTKEFDLDDYVREIPSYSVSLNITYGSYSKTLSTTIVYNEIENELTWPLFDLEGGYEFTSNSNKKTESGYTYGYSISSDKFYVNLSENLSKDLNISYDLDPYVSSNCSYGDLDLAFTVNGSAEYNYTWTLGTSKARDITFTDIEVASGVSNVDDVEVTKLVIVSGIQTTNVSLSNLFNSDGSIRKIRLIDGVFSQSVGDDGVLNIAAPGHSSGTSVSFELTVDDTNCDSETGGTATINNVIQEGESGSDGSGDPEKKKVTYLIIT